MLVVISQPGTGNVAAVARTVLLLLYYHRYRRDVETSYRREKNKLKIIRMRRRREGGGEKWVETTITTFTEDRYATRNRLCFVGAAAVHTGTRSTYGNAVAAVVVFIVAYLSLVLIFINLRTVE